MEKQHDTDMSETIAHYRLGGQVHWIQAGKAWEDDKTWRCGTLHAYDGETATIVFQDPDDSGKNSSSHEPVTSDENGGKYARAAFDLEEAAVENLPLGGLVWVTEQWGVLAFPDEHGNAVALHPTAGMVGTLFARIGTSQLRFLHARRVEEPIEMEDEGVELAYGTVTGTDGVTRFSIIPMEDAEYAARVIDVVSSCATWGEVREMADGDLYDDLLGRSGFGTVEEYVQDLNIGRPIPGAVEHGTERFAELGVSGPPEDDEPFDWEVIEGWQTADFPPATETIQEAFLPQDLADEFGFRSETTFNGTFLELPPESGPPIVAAMEDLGYRCVERPELFRTEMFRFEVTG